MGERKWAWAAFHKAMEDGNSEQIWRAEQMVECAAIKDFTNQLHAELESLLAMTEDVGQSGVSLGIRMVLREIQKLEDTRCD